MKKRKSINDEIVLKDDASNTGLLTLALIMVAASSSFCAPTIFGSDSAAFNQEPAEVLRYTEEISMLSKENSSTNSVYRRVQYFDTVYEKCKAVLPSEEPIEVESCNFLANILSFEKQTRTEDYNQLIYYLISKYDFNVLRAVLNYIASLEYNEITEAEEELIACCLLTNDIVTQESALNALLCLNNYSNIERIEGAVIDNRYLQEDLDSFIKTIKEAM